MVAPSQDADSAAAPRASLREPLVAFAVATALASLLYWLVRPLPWIGANISAVIAVIFLFGPQVAARAFGSRFDHESGGLTIEPLGLNLKVLGAVVAVSFPLFFGAFIAYYGTVCAPSWPHDLPRMCPGTWRGLGGGSFALPASILLGALTQLVVVAVPEEVFFRGYLMQRLEARFPSTRVVLGAPVGWALVLQSLLFALGHVLVDFNPQRFAVFFPGLLFGWMRSRTRSLAAGALYHALCNILSDVLHKSYF